jgi:hypothetical protein
MSRLQLTFVIMRSRIPSLGERQDEVRAQPATPHPGQETRRNFAVVVILEEDEEGADNQFAVRHVEIT